MKWSWRIGRIAGIGVYVHATFPLLLAWVGIAHYFLRHRWTDAWNAVVFILLLFVIVVLHELGHALTARRFGITTRDITLLPIGGVARLERIPEQPRQELLVALAGPAVNVCLAGLFFALIGAGRQLGEMTNSVILEGDLLVNLMWVNVALAVFNLLPAFPMDGGRVLRALLAVRLSYPRATRIAAVIGQGMALLFAFLGLSSFFFGPLGPFSNPFLLFIAAFVWIGAAQESGLVQLKAALGGLTAAQLMIRDFRTLSPRQPLSEAVGFLLQGWQEDFPVLEDGRLVGLLTRPALLCALAEHGQNISIGQAMHRQFSTVHTAEAADAVLLRLRAEDRLTILVTEGDGLRGMLTRANIGEYLRVREALEACGQSAKGARAPATQP
jgi:Zn-dependent protease/CBS domain-containing protein